MHKTTFTAKNMYYMDVIGGTCQFAYMIHMNKKRLLLKSFTTWKFVTTCNNCCWGTDFEEFLGDVQELERLFPLEIAADGSKAQLRKYVLCLCGCVCVFACACACIYICMYVCMHICIYCLCTHARTHTHTHTYIHTYIHIYVFTCIHI